MIRSRDNKRVKALCALLTAKKERIRTGRFAAEGLRLCLEAAKYTPVEQLLLTREAANKHPSAALLLEKAKEVVWLDDALAGRIAGTQATQGIFCICPQLDNTESAVKIKRNGKYLLLHGLQDPGNLGTCIRTAAALGADGLMAASCAELYSPKTLRASMGGAFALPIRVCRELNGVLAELRDWRIPVYAAALEERAVPVTEVDFSKGSAVLIGNEGGGLPAELIAACDQSIVIPMVQGADSLNAAAAASILLWEMTGIRNQRPAKGDREEAGFAGRLREGDL